MWVHYSPTDIEVSLFLQQLVDLLPCLLQHVLDIHLLLLVSGESHVQSSQHTLLSVALQLFLVNVVLRFVATAKVENRGAKLFL